VLRFWRNPEFVRHVRAELRPTRAVTVAVVTLFVCGLIWLSCWSFVQQDLENARSGLQRYGGEQWMARVAMLEKNIFHETWLLFFWWVFAIQGVMLTLWSLFACVQSVSGERDRKTWDFQRATSLTSSEFLVGKLIGEPILTYFLVLCLLPFTVMGGLVGGISLSGLVSAYLLMLGGSLFLGVCGVFLSTLIESGSRGITLLIGLAMYFMTAGAMGMTNSGFPGLAAFSPLSGIMGMYSPNEPTFHRLPTLFGKPVPWLLLSLLLWVTFGSWIVLMLVRNLKRDYDEIRPLSRWQAVGCAAFLNFVLYAMVNPARFGQAGSHELMSLMIGVNGLILFAIGLATLTPQERLRVWWRQRASGSMAMFSEDGLPWPWLALSAVTAYALIVWGTLAWDKALPFEMKSLERAAVQLLVVLVFITRDVLFLQWCKLTHMSRPVFKGLMYLCLYYAAAVVLIVLFGQASETNALRVLSLLTPVGAANPEAEGFRFPASLYLGIALQAGVLAAIVAAIGGRMNRRLLAVASGA
jgi:hypothetical protein